MGRQITCSRIGKTDSCLQRVECKKRHGERNKLFIANTPMKLAEVELFRSDK